MGLEAQLLHLRQIQVRLNLVDMSLLRLDQLVTLFEELALVPDRLLLLTLPLLQQRDQFRLVQGSVISCFVGGRWHGCILHHSPCVRRQTLASYCSFLCGLSWLMS